MSDEVTPVNIGNPEEVSILEFAKEIVEVTGSKSKIIMQPLPDDYADDPKVRRPDITKATRILGWEPKVCRRDGLEKTVQYFREKVLGERA